MNNPLLDFSGLPRFAEIEPGARRARPIDQLLAEARAAMRARRGGARDLGRSSSQPLEDATSAWRAPGARSSTCTRCWTARRCARPTTPTCRRSPSSGPNWARTSALFEKYRRSRPRPDSRALARAQEASVRERAARFPPRRRRTARRSQAALRRDPGGTGVAVGEILRERARCDQRLRRSSSRTRSASPAFPPTTLQAAREAAREGRQGRAGSSPCRCLPTSR